MHVVAVLDVDGEPVANPHERLVDGRDGVAVALDGDLVADAGLALLGACPPLSGGVFEEEGWAPPNRLAINLVGAFAFFILDPEVIADGQQLLAHEKPLAY